ncbi:MAG: hypothetical protein ACE5FW_00025 [Candidatus Aenigmatarchaeota archaeon]
MRYPSVVIEPDCLLDMVTSTTEVYKRETNGYVTKKPGMRRVVLESAAPFQTDERREDSVWHGNMAAFERVIETLREGNSDLVGGYHSHTKEGSGTMLYKADVDFLEEELERVNSCGFNLDRWLEIIIFAKRKKYKRKQKREFSAFEVGDRIEIIKISPKERFDLKLAGYWVFEENGKMRKEQVKLYPVCY